MLRFGDACRRFAHLYRAITATSDILESMSTHKCYGGEGFQERISGAYTVDSGWWVEHCPFASSPDEVTCDPYREIRGPADIPLAALQL